MKAGVPLSDRVLEMGIGVNDDHLVLFLHFFFSSLYSSRSLVLGLNVRRPQLYDFY